MADYYPLLARALEAMPDRSPALRKAVYERARSALIGQLRSLDPPLSDADIDLEARALETAIDRLETEHAPPAPEPKPDLPAPDPADAWRNLPESMPEARVPEPLRVAPEAPEPFLPSAPPPDLGRTPFMPPDASPGPAPIIPIQARKGREPAPVSDPAAEALLVPTEPALPEPGADDLVADTGGGRQRPRIDVVAPRASRSRLLRNIAVGAVLFTVIGLIAVAAFLLRDKPADLQSIATEQQDTVPDAAESKYADRIGGDPVATPPARIAQAPTPPNAAVSDVSVAQRAVLYEENTSATNAPPTTVQGRVLWRLESVNGERGQPLETAVRANVEFPDAGITLTLTINRNRDATLPASHTIELAFTTDGPPGSARRTVQDIGLLQAKEEENARGSPVSGLPVRVRENLFLIGLSSLRNDIERNTDLLQHRNWFELAVKFSTGSRAILNFEKGSPGAQVIEKAFAQWH